MAKLPYCHSDYLLPFNLDEWVDSERKKRGLPPAHWVAMHRQPPAPPAKKKFEAKKFRDKGKRQNGSENDSHAQ